MKKLFTLLLMFVGIVAHAETTTETFSLESLLQSSHSWIVPHSSVVTSIDQVAIGELCNGTEIKFSRESINTTHVMNVGILLWCYVCDASLCAEP